MCVYFIFYIYFPFQKLKKVSALLTNKRCICKFLNNFIYIFFNRSLIGMRLKPLEASRLLPVFDDVNLKAVFSMSVARPHRARVLSNMPLNTSRSTCVIHAVLIAAASTFIYLGNYINLK